MSCAALAVFRSAPIFSGVRVAWSSRRDIAWLVGTCLHGYSAAGPKTWPEPLRAQGRPEDLPRSDRKHEDNTWSKHVQLVLLPMVSPVPDPEQLQHLQASPYRQLAREETPACGTSPDSVGRFSLHLLL